MMKNEGIGQKIKKIRAENNLTQQEFAESLGYKDKSMISHIEKGDADMTYEKIILLIKKYGVDANRLFEEESEIDEDQHSRSKMLIGEEGFNKLKNSKILLFGLGGVGGSCFEALVRSGIGEITVVDKDDFEASNLNRQLLCTYDTLGKPKVEIAKRKAKSINPKCKVNPVKLFYLPETKEQFDFSKYDYVIDCVDTVTAKLSIVEEANRCKVKVISAMGAGNKLHPELLEISDIYKTDVDPLAKVMRRELKKRNINHLKVVYSKETPIKNSRSEPQKEKGRVSPSSMVFVPSSMGYMLASEVVNDLLK